MEMVQAVEIGQLPLVPLVLDQESLVFLVISRRFSRDRFFDLHRHSNALRPVGR
jgi:hypothetical protein